MKVKGSHDNLTEDMMVEVVKRQHSVRNTFQIRFMHCQTRRINLEGIGCKLTG